MLYNIIRDKILIKPDPDRLVILDQLYIDSRYPGETGLLPDGKPDLKESKRLYSFAMEIVEAAKKSCIKS